MNEKESKKDLVNNDDNKAQSISNTNDGSQTNSEKDEPIASSKSKAANCNFLIFFSGNLIIDLIISFYFN